MNGIPFWMILGAGGVTWLAWESNKQRREKVARDAAARSKSEAALRATTPGTAEYEQRIQREADLRAREADLKAAKRAREAEALAVERAAGAEARAAGRYITDWESAERAVEWAMSNTLKCTKVRWTGKGADGGIDVDSAEMSAQVKYLSKPVGRPEVHRIKGAAGRRVPALFAYGTNPQTVFAKPAVERANMNKAALFAINAHATLTAISKSAASILDGEPLTPAAGAVVATAAVSMRKKAGGECPSCGGTLARRKNRSTGQWFLGCSNWPVCKKTFAVP